MLTKAASSLPLAGEAFAAVWNSDNDRALALLHNVDAPGCAVMRARVWLRLERFDRVLSEYERRWLAAYQPAEATGLACCAAVAFAARGDASAAWDAHAAAEASAKRVSDPLLHLHVAFTVALLHLITGDVARSRHAIAMLAARADTLPHLEARTAYQWELPHLRARISQHLGRHYELEHDRVAGERCYMRALREAEGARNRDRYLEARLLALLAAVISETPADESRAYVVARANVPWSSHLDQSTTFVRHALDNNHRLFGSRAAVESKTTRGAPSLAARLDDRVNALLLEDWPDPVTFYAECRFAISLALDIDWSRTAEHEVFALARLSAVLAPFEYTLAKTVAQTYEARIEQLSPNCATRRNPTRPVHEMLRAACLAKAAGELEEAAAIFGRVAKESHERGVPWRAAIAGLERYAVTRDDRDLATARVFAKAYPASSFSRRLRRGVAAAVAGDRAFAYLGTSGPDARSDAR